MREAEFHKFLEILRSGDDEAVDRLLSDFDPYLRRAIRTHLFEQRARRVVDTADILQSLLKDFLQRKGTEEAAVSSQKLRAYLNAAAQYKVASKVRKERRRVADLADVPEPASRESPPEKSIEDRELIDAIRQRLDERDRRLFDLSRAGRTWREIAIETGGQPDSLRMQLRRSIAAAIAETRPEGSSHAG
jgi:DNA-directed RNA polymerase specialized sigma24 family protein